MFPRKKENGKQKTEDGGQKTEIQTSSDASSVTASESAEMQKRIDELCKQVEEKQKEKDDIFAKLQRVAADYDNYQKRSARQIKEGITHEIDRIIKALLPVMDNFECILANTSCGVNDEALLRGVQIIYDQLTAVLKTQGVEQIKAQGEKFDPAHHEAITQRTEQDKEDGVILEELQKGYKVNGRVIRASRVVVNKVPAPAPETQQPPEEPETKDTQ
jgi:molecular chaperone GrpE